MAHTLLVADDSPTIQRVVELTFAGEDVTVMAASDGDQAIAVLERHEPDLVLVDVNMPGRGGYDVAHYVRATSRLAHIPVLLMIGAFDQVDESRARALGCAGVLVKPFEPQLLAERVKALLLDPTGPFFLETSPARRSMAAVVMKDAFAPPPDEPDRTAASAEVDQYFDRLDQAFANLSTSPVAEPRSHVTDATEFAARRSASLGRDESREPDQPLRGPAPISPPSPPAAGPSPLADAFGALLAAEESAPPPDSLPSWPAAAPIDADALVEQISARVLERLTDRVVRETAAQIISQVAERLVLEEIERIKSRLR
jgi:CheY-like chemotaxis protein